jgi:hypothetical protein
VFLHMPVCAHICLQITGPAVPNVSGLNAVHAKAGAWWSGGRQLAAIPTHSPQVLQRLHSSVCTASVFGCRRHDGVCDDHHCRPVLLQLEGFCSCAQGGRGSAMYQQHQKTRQQLASVLPQIDMGGETNSSWYNAWV